MRAIRLRSICDTLPAKGVARSRRTGESGARVMLLKLSIRVDRRKAFCGLGRLCRVGLRA